ncbi:hypothetical protein GCM10023144_45910 [Pigmentiphaga soli]|uniref:Uncharacterized protein n=1 Tax=Pigmentiphaga soli TaxID=1007095 RepID=A0ABP8HRK2_9BURK
MLQQIPGQSVGRIAERPEQITLTIGHDGRFPGSWDKDLINVAGAQLQTLLNDLQRPALHPGSPRPRLRRSASAAPWERSRRKLPGMGLLYGFRISLPKLSPDSR